MKETTGYVMAVIAVIGCCLLLTTLIAGGTFGFLGAYLNNYWLLIIGLVIVAVAFSIIVGKKRGSTHKT